MPDFHEPSKPLRFALLGYGQHAELMCRAFLDTKYCELKAIGTSSSEKCSRLRLRYPEIEIFSSYDEAVHCSHIDAVLITLPNHLHAPWAICSLSASKHVLCEKPLATNLEEARAIWRESKRANALLAAGFAYRLHPQHQQVRSFLQENALGSMKTFESVYHYELFDPRNIRLQQATGGGALLDAGCYPLDAACFLTGYRPIHVQARSVIDPETHIDKDIEIELHFPNQIRALLRASTQRRRENWYRFSGSDGSLTCRNAYHVLPGQKTVLELQRKGKPVEIFHFEPCNQFALELDAFATSLAVDSPIATQNSILDDGFLHMHLIDAVQSACKQEEPIAFASPIRD